MNMKRTSEGGNNREWMAELRRLVAEVRFNVLHNVGARASTATGLIALLKAEPSRSEDKEKIFDYLLTTLKEIDQGTQYVLLTLDRIDKKLLDVTCDGKEGEP